LNTEASDTLSEVAQPDMAEESPPYGSINGAALLDEIDAYLRRYVVYPDEHMRRAHNLWIAHTHLMDCWESTPRFACLSPEPASGKTRALEVTEPLVPRPIHAVNVTSAYLFRKLSDPCSGYSKNRELPKWKDFRETSAIDLDGPGPNPVRAPSSGF
jgi:hypothetical protein